MAEEIQDGDGLKRSVSQSSAVKPTLPKGAGFTADDWLTCTANLPAILYFLPYGLRPPERADNAWSLVLRTNSEYHILLAQLQGRQKPLRSLSISHTIAHCPVAFRVTGVTSTVSEPAPWR
ncbi:hypothetical protein ElyMa_002999300 [Elysia marginata]|uniref:Uncharacterized protein n=1 Tax=Elysia marginata TaxID=1093978 RepID=A0AAV4IDP2_9GAST|nr:hypothetical protein ElyMa_002999300 [Elysia marginata]